MTHPATQTKTAHTEAQVAERYGLARKTLQSWRINGGGPAFVKMGKALRYLEADLIAWEAKCKRTSTAQVEAA